MNWTYDTGEITKKDIVSSLRIALRHTIFRRKSKAIATWICYHTMIPSISSVKNMLQKLGIVVTTYQHYFWLVTDIMDKHSNFHQNVLLDRTHVTPVRRRNNNQRRTHTTVYPCGIQVKNIKHRAVTASTSVIKNSKHVVTTQLDMNGQERSPTLNVWDTSKDVSVKTGYRASNHTGGTENDCLLYTSPSPRD